MEWTHILAYITGAVDQELLLRNEYLADTDPAPAILFADHLAHKHGTAAHFAAQATTEWRKTSNLTGRLTLFPIPLIEGLDKLEFI